MKKFAKSLVLAFALILILPGIASASSTVTVNLQTILGSTYQGDAYIHIRLMNYSGNVPKVINVGPIIKTEDDVFPDVNGLISKTVYRNDTEISPLNTYYDVEYWSGGRMRYKGRYSVNKASFNLNTEPEIVIAPTAASLVVANVLPIYSTPSAAVNASITATTMATPASNTIYRASFYAAQVAVGTSCTTNSTVNLLLIYQDPNAAGSASISVFNGTVNLGTNNGTAGFVLGQSNVLSNLLLHAKASTNVQYSATFVAGANCAPAPTYQIFPQLEQIAVQ